MNRPVPGSKLAGSLKMRCCSRIVADSVQVCTNSAMQPCEFVVGRRSVLELSNVVETKRQYTFSDPGPQFCMVDIRIDPGEVFEQIVDRGDVGRSHDPIVFIDPHTTRNVDKPVAFGNNMVGVDHTGVGRIRGFNPFSRRRRFIERNGDNRETEFSEFFLQCLPPGQVISAASPTRPDDQYLLFSADLRHRELVAVGIAEREIGGDPIVQVVGDVGDGLAEGDHSSSGVDHDGTTQRSRQRREIDRVTDDQLASISDGHADIALTQTFSLELPTGGWEQVRGRDARAIDAVDGRDVFTIQNRRFHTPGPYLNQPHSVFPQHQPALSGGFVLWKGGLGAGAGQT